MLKCDRNTRALLRALLGDLPAFALNPAHPESPHPRFKEMLRPQLFPLLRRTLEKCLW